MKRGILVATMMVTAAGVASANLLTTAPQSAAPPAHRAEPAASAPPIVTKTIQSEPAPSASRPASPKMAAAPTVQKSTVEMRQAPVPLQVKPRVPVNVPAANAKATEAKPGETPAEQPAADDAAGEKAAARAAIEADGYKGVKVLRKGANGVWHASALRGKTTVMLTVDGSGSVSAD
jgi:hypothetical protein